MRRLLFVLSAVSLALALGGGCHAAGEVVGDLLARALAVVSRAATYIAQTDVRLFGHLGTLAGLALSGLCFVGLICRAIWKP